MFPSVATKIPSAIALAPVHGSPRGPRRDPVHAGDGLSVAGGSQVFRSVHHGLTGGAASGGAAGLGRRAVARRRRHAPPEAVPMPGGWPPGGIWLAGGPADMRGGPAGPYNSPHLYGRSYSRLRSPSASGGGPLPRASRTWMAQFSRSRCHGTGRRLPSRVIRCRVLTGRQHVVAGGRETATPAE